MKKIFISHADADPNLIKSNIHILRYYLLDYLNDPDVEIILDDIHLISGKNMDDFMFDSIKESCCAICICTPEYFISSSENNSGVDKELKEILKKFNENKTFQIKPLIFDGVPEQSIPECLNRFFAENYTNLLVDVKNHVSILSKFASDLKQGIDGFNPKLPEIDFSKINDNEFKTAKLMLNNFVTDISLIDLNPELISEVYHKGIYGSKFVQKDYQIVFKIRNTSNIPFKIQIVGLKDNYGSNPNLSSLNEKFSKLHIVNPSDFSYDSSTMSFDLLKFSELPNYFIGLKNPEEGYSNGFSFDIEYKINDIYFKNNLRTSTRIVEEL